MREEYKQRFSETLYKLEKAAHDFGFACGKYGVISKETGHSLQQIDRYRREIYEMVDINVPVDYGKQGRTIQ